MLFVIMSQKNYIYGEEGGTFMNPVKKKIVSRKIAFI